jgi:hypothetical protein
VYVQVVFVVAVVVAEVAVVDAVAEVVEAAARKYLYLVNLFLLHAIDLFWALGCRWFKRSRWLGTLSVRADTRALHGKKRTKNLTGGNTGLLVLPLLKFRG